MGFKVVVADEIQEDFLEKGAGGEEGSESSEDTSEETGESCEATLFFGRGVEV